VECNIDPVFSLTQLTTTPQPHSTYTNLSWALVYGLQIQTTGDKDTTSCFASVRSFALDHASLPCQGETLTLLAVQVVEPKKPRAQNQFYEPPRPEI
jgi:hypothetical protein